MRASPTFLPSELLHEASRDLYLRAFMQRVALPDVGDPTQAGRDAKDMEDQRKLELELAAEREAEIYAERATGNHIPRGLDPVTIGKLLIKELEGIEEEDRPKLGKILEKAFPDDTVTGFYEKHTLPGIVGLAHLNAKELFAGNLACLLEGDFINLGKCNETIGEENTNKLIHEVCSILEKRLIEAGAIEVQGIRKGGDEVQLVVHGLTTPAINATLKEKIYPEIALLAAKYDVYDLVHSKANEGKLPGFGIACACVDLVRPRAPEEIRSVVDMATEYHKKFEGLLRAGITTENDLDTYIQANQPQVAIAGNGNAEANKKFLSSMTDIKKNAYLHDVNMYWNNLIAEGGYYHSDYQEFITSRPDVRHGPSEFFKYWHTQHGEDINNWHPQLPPPKTAAEKIPFYDEKYISGYDEAPEISRLRCVLAQFSSFQDLAQAEPLCEWNQKEDRYRILPELLDKHKGRLLRIVIDLMEIFEARDPASHCKSTYLMLEDIEALRKRPYFKSDGSRIARFKLDNIDALKAINPDLHNILDDIRTKDGGLRVVKFKLENISGLNTINPNLADAVLDRAGTIIREEFRKNKEGFNDAADYISHEGGGLFCAVLPASYPDDKLATVCHNIEVNVQEQITDARIVDFAKNSGFAAHRTDAAVEIDALKLKLRQEKSNFHKLKRSRISLPNRQRDDVEALLMSQVPHPKGERKLVAMTHYVDAIPPGDDIPLTLQTINNQSKQIFDKWAVQIYDQKYPTTLAK